MPPPVQASPRGLPAQGGGRSPQLRRGLGGRGPGLLALHYPTPRDRTAAPGPARPDRARPAPPHRGPRRLSPPRAGRYAARRRTRTGQPALHPGNRKLPKPNPPHTYRRHRRSLTPGRATPLSAHVPPVPAAERPPARVTAAPGSEAGPAPLMHRSQCGGGKEPPPAPFVTQRAGAPACAHPAWRHARAAAPPSLPLGAGARCQCRLWAPRVRARGPAVLTGAAAANKAVRKCSCLYQWGFSPVTAPY